MMIRNPRPGCNLGNQNSHVPLAEAAQALCCERRKILRLVRDGKLEAVKVGNRWLIAVESLDTLLNGTKRRHRARSVATPASAEAARLAAVWGAVR
jgi:excisionase family DNA binding protein